MNKHPFSLVDKFIIQTDQGLRNLVAGIDRKAERTSPARNAPFTELSNEERRHSAGLMRVNHTGEICAQALYQGQALTAKLPHVREEMEKAAKEEVDHLVWCQDRLEQLNSHTSALNPLWYGMSFAIGAAAGLISDKMSLGFVAATEDQVCKHLENHLQSLPENDTQSRAIVSKMLEDEAKHAQTALEAGGYQFPTPIKLLMSLASKAMTKTSYHI